MQAWLMVPARDGEPAGLLAKEVGAEVSSIVVFGVLPARRALLARWMC